MKVIKKGKVIKGTMRVKCRTCNAELEIQAADLKKETGDRPFDPTCYYFKCPCCRRENCLFYSDLTEEILYDLEN